MKATKYTMEVQMGALSKDVFRGMLVGVLEELDKEVVSSSSCYDDGDYVSFNINMKEVEF
ncbi:MAG: hypothetical protein ACXW1D_00250 [Halobacteriota archaeon]